MPWQCIEFHIGFAQERNTALLKLDQSQIRRKLKHVCTATRSRKEEILVDLHWTARCYVPEHVILNKHFFESIRSNMIMITELTLITGQHQTISGADCLDNVGFSTSNNPIGLHGMLTGKASLYGDGVCVL
jgi:hypothetical protein